MEMEENGARSCIPLTLRTQSYKIAERISNIRLLELNKEISAMCRSVHTY